MGLLLLTYLPERPLKMVEFWSNGRLVKSLKTI
jgi:hypothetical protein